MEKIGFVGGGNMAEALIKGIISANVDHPENVYASDVRLERLAFLAKWYGIGAVESNADLAAKVGILVLSVKPQNMSEALESIKDTIGADKLVISIAATLGFTKNLTTTPTCSSGMILLLTKD